MTFKLDTSDRKGKVNDFLKKTEYKITSIADKKKLKESIDELINVDNKTIEQNIGFADEKGIVKKDDNLNSFIKENSYIYDRVKQVQYLDIVNLYNFEEDLTPYSTQHGIKGAEFDNVFVALDNGRWNDYNFKYLFEERGTESVLERTRKMFYVSCSRAKDNLVVFYHKPSDAVLEKAKEWFGEENVIPL